MRGVPVGLEVVYALRAQFDVVAVGQHMMNGSLRDDAAAFHAGMNDTASVEFLIRALGACDAQWSAGPNVGLGWQAT
ncbi:hypothetical protein WI95_09935 [Burkholderia contaminans]|nr:hypothetical protein WI95_09935 [Burkholderia contaminans]TCW70043.1 hypothetical protein C5O79_11805 [Burkholderia sp. SRS-25]